MTNATEIVPGIIFYSFLSATRKEHVLFLDFSVLVLQVSGRMTLETSAQTLTTKPGDMLLIRKHQLAQLTKNPLDGSDYQTIVIALQDDILRTMALEECFEVTRKYAGAPNTILPDTDFLRGYFLSVMPYIRNPVEKITTAMGILKVREGVQLLLHAMPALKDQLFDFSEPHKVDLEKFMLGNFHFNVPIEKFARLTGRSLAGFKRDFQKTFGASPRQWLQEKRLTEAHHLIEKKHKKPSDIYLDLGFESLSHFSRSFKQRFGMSPSALVGVLLLALAWLRAGAQAPNTPGAPYALRVDLLRSPWVASGAAPTVTSHFPTFSWAVSSPSQSAYQIVVTGDSGDIWNSGQRRSDSSIGVLYTGPGLLPDTRYRWKVRTWDRAGKASEYSATQAFRAGATLSDFGVPPVVLVKTLQRPQNINDSLYDFGKDAFGQPRITVSSPRDVDTLLVRLGEALTSDGRIDRHPPGTVRYREIKVPLQQGTHTYEPVIEPTRRKNAVPMPSSTGEVLPFRYLEVSGASRVSGADSVSRYMVTSPFDDTSTVFSSSDTVLDRVWDLCKYTIKATSFSGYYVDGDRERVPYEADALIAQLSHYASDAEFTMAERTLDYLIDHPTWPTEWSLQDILIAWYDYLYTGDIRLVRRLYPDLKNKLLGSLARPDGLISTRTGKQTPAFLASIHAGAPLKDIVDWPPPGFGGPNTGVGEQDGFVFSDYNSVVNAYYYAALTMMARLALAVDRPGDTRDAHRAQAAQNARDAQRTGDARYFTQEAARVRAAFQRAFIDPATHLVLDGEGVTHSSLHANFFALAFGLVPTEDVPVALSFIHTHGMACSVYGAQFLLDALARANDAGYALQLITSNGKRSWANMLREGATMTMESWGQEYKPNQDWNHAWGTAPANYIVRHFCGIEPLTPGFGEVQIYPHPGPVTSASIKYTTIRGQIIERFENTPERFRLWLTLPGNTHGRVYLPAGQIIKMDGKIVASPRITGVAAGRHYFEVYSPTVYR